MVYCRNKMKQKYWILKVFHTCRNCGYCWVDYVRQYYEKPKDKHLTHTFIVEQYHCVNT